VGILVVSKQVAAQTDFDTPAVALAMAAGVFVDAQAGDGLGARRVEVQRERCNHPGPPVVTLKTVEAARNVRAEDDTGLAVDEEGACRNVLQEEEEEEERGRLRLHVRERGRLVRPPLGF